MKCIDIAFVISSDWLGNIQIHPFRMTIKINKFVRPIGIKKHNRINFAGSAFGLEKPGLCVTAAHIVRDMSRDQIVLEHGTDLGESSRFWLPTSVTIHPSADIAVMKFDKYEAIPFFKIAEPPIDIGEFHLGTEVRSYGYPRTVKKDNWVSLEPRLMTGTIQRVLPSRHERLSYQTYELSFPSVDGQSGSPVFLVEDSNSALAMVIGNFESSVQVDEDVEHIVNGNLKKQVITKKVVSYGIGLALWPLADWIRSL